MKNFTKKATALILSGAIVLGSTVAFAGNGTDKELVKVKKTSRLQHQVNPVTNSMKVVLGVKMDESQKIKLEVLDVKDNVVFKEVYKDTKGFIQMFDLEALGEGEYLFRIVSGNTTYIDKVTVGKEAPKLEAFQAYISDMENDKLKFSYADGKGDVILSVKNTNGETIFTESLGKDFSSSGIANLSELENGEYTIQLKSASGTQSKTIQKG